MIAYITIGADDMDAAGRFYGAFLPALGYTVEEYHGDLSFIPLGDTGPDFYIKRPFNSAPASVGNGTMVAFQAQTQADVRTLHAAALAAGGTDDGAPGFRDDYSADFYVGYLRDPQGNKVALFSANPDEPGRDG